jgi:hypothetical protein
MSDGLDRSGHLSDYALDRLRFDPPSSIADLQADAFTGATNTHLTSCDLCRARLAALVEADASESFAPRLAPTAPSGPTRVRRRAPRLPVLRILFVPLALAALALFIARPWSTGGTAPPFSDGDVRTLKGTRFELELYVHDGAKSRPVATGDVVSPGDRLGFRAWALTDGHLLIIGQDELGHTYGCWPQAHSARASDPQAARAVPLPRTDTPQVLPTAMRFDDVPGTETITAIFCPDPFGFVDLVASPRTTAGANVTLSAPPRSGCAMRIWQLHKRSGGPE